MLRLGQRVVYHEYPSVEKMDRLDRLERGRVMSKSANNYSPLRNEVQGTRVAWKPIDEAGRSYVETVK